MLKVVEQGRRLDPPGLPGPLHQDDPVPLLVRSVAQVLVDGVGDGLLGAAHLSGQLSVGLVAVLVDLPLHLGDELVGPGGPQGPRTLFATSRNVVGIAIILYERVPSLPLVVDGRLGVVEKIYHLLGAPPGAKGCKHRLPPLLFHG